MGFVSIQPNWETFQILPAGEKLPYLRALSTPEGLGDRLRFVAFAELQAAHAFHYAPEVFALVPHEVKTIWKTLAKEERKHYGWLIQRMHELNVSIPERPVNLALWSSFQKCSTAKQFADFMANAEDRGKTAGHLFYETLKPIDAKTAEIFHQIALEEEEHIELAKQVFAFQLEGY